MNRQRIAGIALLVLLLLPAAVQAPSPGADVDSPDPLGMRDMATAARDDGRQVTTLFASQSALRHLDEPVGLVLVPGVPGSLTDGETAALQDHLDRGAWVWILDETGGAASLTEPLGLNVTPEAVLDPDSPYGQGFVEATAEQGDTTHRLLLTHATVLEVATDRATVLARTAEAFRDVDRSGAIEATDPAGNHTVAGMAEAGQGRLIVTTDAGLFTNSLLRADGYDNQAFLEAMLAQAPDGVVVVDTSRHGPDRGLAPLKVATQGLLEVTTDPIGLTLLLATTGLLGVVLVRRAPERQGWGTHEHATDQRLPVPTEEAEARLHRLLALAVREHVQADASELVAMEPEALRARAEDHLETGEYLSDQEGIEARSRALLEALEGGGRRS